MQRCAKTRDCTEMLVIALLATLAGNSSYNPFARYAKFNYEFRANLWSPRATRRVKIRSSACSTVLIPRRLWVDAPCDTGFSLPKRCADQVPIALALFQVATIAGWFSRSRLNDRCSCNVLGLSRVFGDADSQAVKLDRPGGRRDLVGSG